MSPASRLIGQLMAPGAAHLRSIEDTERKNGKDRRAGSGSGLIENEVADIGPVWPVSLI